MALRTSIERVDRAKHQLDQLGSFNAKPPVATSDLQRPMSLTWSGPLDQGVKSLADSIGYRFVVTAPADSAPVQVSISMTAVPVIDVLQAMGIAAGAKATVTVDTGRHQVEVQHHV